MSDAKFSPVYELTMYQARCTNCGYIETDYGDYAAWADDGTPRDHVVDAGWFARWSYQPNPTPDNPRGQIGTLEELLCELCQKCDVCGADDARDVNGDEHLVCGDHEDHDFESAS